MRAVIYIILWAILTTLVCYLIYEFRQEQNILETEIVTTTDEVQIIDEVDGSSYIEELGDQNDNTENSDRKSITASNISQQEAESHSQDYDPESQTEILDERSESPTPNNMEKEYFVERAYIEFGQNSTRLPTNARFDNYLDSVAQVIKTGKFTVLLEGHTDYSKSSKQDNYQIGLKRAEFIKAMLTTRNVASSEISVKSLGDSSPRVEGTTKEARALNRRVELFINPKK